MSSNDSTPDLTARIYKARGADLLRYLRHRMRNEADARDIVQEAFMRFLRLEDPERLRSPEAYLFRIAGNLLWERQLRERSELGQTPLEETPVEEHTPFDLAVTQQDTARIRAAMGTLPPLWRAVLMLHLRDGLSFSQIAANTGITTSLAKKSYYRAVIACREYLETLDTPVGGAP